MRQRRLILFCSVLVAIACTQQVPEVLEPEINTGKLSVLLQTDSRIQVTKAVTTAEFVPEINQLKVEVFKNPGADQIRLYRDTYENTMKLEGGIPLNCADYRLLASFGDSLGVGFTPDKVYYSGSYDFVLEPNEVEEAEIIVKPDNVRASIVFGDNLKFDYNDNYYAKVRSLTPGGKVKSLRYDYDETRSGYVPAGKVRVELYTRIDGVEMYCPGPELDLAGGTDITFNIETVRIESDFTVQLTVIQPDEIEKSFTVPAVMLPKDTPQIDEGGLNETSYSFEPGDQPVEGLRMDMKADGNIKNCWLNINSDYLASIGVPSRVDLAKENLGLEDAQAAAAVKETLEGVGLRWMSNMEGSRLAYVDFSGVTKFITSTPCTPAFDADFSLELVDSRQQSDESQHVGSVMTDTYTFTQVIPAPTMQLNGLGDSKVYILEGNRQTFDDMTAEILAKGGIKHCWLNIDSPYLKTLGVNESKIDLANLDENSSVAQTLRSLGLSWTPAMAGARTGLVDFSSMTEYMDNNGCDGINATFADMSLTLETSHCESESDKVLEVDIPSFEYVIPTVTVGNDVLAGNVWAKKILDFSADCSVDDASGLQVNPDNFKIQYKEADEWIDLPSTAYAYPTRSCGRFEAKPSTQYQFRAIYNNNPNLVANFTGCTTESELQIPGADFNSIERLSYQYYAVKIKVWIFDFGGDIYLDRDYYLPEPKNIWAVNSKRTMPSQTTPNFTINALGYNYETGDTQTYKVFPTVTKYNVDNETKNYGLQIATMHVCNMATEANSGDGGLGSLGGSISGVTKTEYLSAGEVCIGSADNSGNLTYGTYAFASRPSKVKVRYKYDSYDSETGYFKLQFKSGSEVIAVHEANLPAASEWTEYIIDVPYTSNMKKATSAFATFKSTNKSTPSFKGDGARTLKVEETEHKVHSGSVLVVDDMTFIYE